MVTNIDEAELQIEAVFLVLEGKDNSEAFRLLQNLEKFSEESNRLYPYTNKFADMVKSEKYAVWVRGFRLFCRQARWDTQRIVDKRISETLAILKDEKPTAVRQALAALPEVIRFKPELKDLIKEAVLDIDYLQYKETMHSLLVKDIQVVIDAIETV